MSPRLTKQLVYGLFYLALFGAIGYGLYATFLKSAPSCFNNIRDGAEEGVDCGGICERVCLPPDLLPVSVGRATIFTPAPDRISALVKLQNPNRALGLRRFTYRFTFFDASGAVLATREGNSFLYPGEIKHLTEFISTPASEAVFRAEVGIENLEWIAAEDFPRPMLLIQDREVEATETGVEVRGRLQNRDTVTLPQVTVIAIFEGPFGNEVGVSETSFGGLAPGESRLFTVLHPPIAGVPSPRADLFISAERPR